MSIQSRMGQSGLSLIELMVALLLSSFLILGITQIYLDDKQNYIYQQNQIGNQENSRFAFMFVGDLLTKTGYRARPNLDSQAEAFPPLQAFIGCPAFQAGETVKLGQDGASICVRYQRGMESKESDCSGTSIASSSMPSNVLSRLIFDKAKGEISCRAMPEPKSSPNQGSTALPSSETAVLLSGLMDVHVSPVPRKNDKVQAIRLSLLFVSDGSPRQGVGSAVVDKWNALTPTKLKLPDSDQRVFQISQHTITLRNLTP
ncbi:hypothetical protein D9M71_143740 [compost metagenome]